MAPGIVLNWVPFRLRGLGRRPLHAQPGRARQLQGAGGRALLPRLVGAGGGPGLAAGRTRGRAGRPDRGAARRARWSCASGTGGGFVRAPVGGRLRGARGAARHPRRAAPPDPRGRPARGPDRIDSPCPFPSPAPRWRSSAWPCCPRAPSRASPSTRWATPWPQGGSSYARDDDPELVWEAVPFGLKTVEGLLEEAPRHKGLLFAAASGFVQYGYGARAAGGRLHRGHGPRPRHRAADAGPSPLPARARLRLPRAWRWTSPACATRLRKEGAARPGPHAQGARAPALLHGARLVRRHLPVQGRLRADRGPGPGGSAHAPRPGPRRGLRPAEPCTTSSSRGRAAGESVGGSFERARKHFERAEELAGGRRVSAYVNFAETVSVARPGP